MAPQAIEMGQNGRLDAWCSVKAGFTYTLSSLKMDAEMAGRPAVSARPV